MPFPSSSHDEHKVLFKVDFPPKLAHPTMSHPASSPLRLPDFIGIGAMRAGTSWLRKQLARHPDVWTAEPKELHFFDRHFEDDPAAYAEHFKTAPSNQVAGEITPAYAILDDTVIATAKGWMPDAQLLFMMRDPIERAWSHAKKDFPQFRGKAAEEAPAEELIAFMDMPAVADRGNYLACLKRWLRHFGRDQLWCGFLDEVAIDPEPVLRDLFTFLKVDPDNGIDAKAAAKRENARPGAAAPNAVREHLQSTLYAHNGELSALLGRDIPWD